MHFATDINEDALRYWSRTGYSSAQLDAYCRANDQEFMMARVVFAPGEEPKVTISNRTWALQEGHYGAIYRFFMQLAATEIGRSLSGTILIHLEDGIFEHTRHITREVPLLGFGRSVDDTYSFLMPDPAFLYSDGYCQEIEQIVTRERELAAKKINRIFWRGAASGTNFHNQNWRDNARGKLVLFAKETDNQSILDAKLTKIDHLPEDQQQHLKESEVIDTYTDFNDFLKYKYLIDVDGYHCAWKSLFLKLASQSVVLKVSSNLEQWYYRNLKPWQHFIPVRSDSSDLIEIYNWVERNQENCQQIIRNANLLVDSITIQSETEYMAKLCKRILSLCRSSEEPT